MARLDDSQPVKLVRLCGEDVQLARRLWCTALAAALSNQLPYEWHVDLTQPLEERTTTENMAARWIEDTCVEPHRHPEMAEYVSILHDEALAKVIEWETLQEARVNQFYQSHKTSQPPASWQKRVMEMPRRSWRACRALMYQMLTTHPIGAISQVHATDVFTQGNRILVMFTTFCTLLLMAILLHYSRAINCSTEKVEYMGCPESTDSHQIFCFGFSTYIELSPFVLGGFVPEELAMKDFECDAFPRDTIVDRILTVGLMVLVLLPVSVVLNAVFTFNTAKIPNHWHQAMHKCPSSEKMSKFQNSCRSIVQLFFFMMYALFINIDKVNKALAMLFVSLFTICFRPVTTAVAIILWFGHIWTQTKTLVSKCRHWLVVGTFQLPERQLDSLAGSPLGIRTISGEWDDWVAGVSYTFVFTIWSLIGWMVLTYAKLLRELSGKEGESNVFESFILALLMEQFGLEGVKQVIFKTLVSMLLNLTHRLTNALSPLDIFYETKVNERLSSQNTGNEEEDDVDDEQIDLEDGGMEIDM
eukprot:gene25796-31562_t